MESTLFSGFSSNRERKIVDDSKNWLPVSIFFWLINGNELVSVPNMKLKAFVAGILARLGGGKFTSPSPPPPPHALTLP